MRQLTTLCLVLALTTLSSAAFSSRHFIARGRSKRLASQSPDEVERLRDSASKLRQEVEALKEELGERKGLKKSDAVSIQQPASQLVLYMTVPDSIWTFTYRFSSEPEPEEDSDKDETIARTSYSGKLTLKFRADGYTDILTQEATGATLSQLQIEKAWGWDEEISNEDGLRYILFSTNVKLSEQDASMPGQTQRFYWQARLDTDSSTKSISLVDGTITVKKDVKPPGGFWGVFDGGGILAQFRYVGNFAAKPAS